MCCVDCVYCCLYCVIVFCLRRRRPTISSRTDTLFPYTTRFRSLEETRAFSTQALGSLQAQPAAAVLDRCRAQRESLRDARLRYAELCECALDEDMIAAFAARLAAHGLVDIAHAPIEHDNGMLMGWTLTARKP